MSDRSTTTGFEGGDNVVLTWNSAVLEGVRASDLGPPMVARALAIVHTCIFDAWAAYDQRAVGTRLGVSLRRPPSECTAANKERAISFGAYRAAVDLFPVTAQLFDELMFAMGHDPFDDTSDATTPAGIGNVTSQAVLDFRHGDGSNQLGDMHPGAYSDYTGYVPANQPDRIIDPSRWQPLRLPTAPAGPVTQSFVGPHWGLVKPFGLRSGSQFRSSTGPARWGSAQYGRQAQEVLDISACLTEEQKVVAKYWADGPRSEQPPGHWNLFAQFVSRRDGHDLDGDVKMFFLLTNAIFDAGIVAWDNKRFFDSARPITAIRHLFKGQAVRAWGGLGGGTELIEGEAWMPYQPGTILTPPFPEYSSGHSNFSAAGAEVLRRYTGSDDFGHSALVPAGTSRVEPGRVPARDTTLRWATFSEAADQAGISRLYGGIHFRQGDLDGRMTGRSAAELVWTKAQGFIRP